MPTEKEPELPKASAKKKRFRNLGGKKTGQGTKIVLRLVTVLVLACLLCVGAWFGWRRFTQVKVERLRAMVSRELRYCAELTTVKNTYSNIVTLKRSTFFGLARSYTIARYTATARAGIADLTKSEVHISEDGKGVVLRLPPVEVLSNAITSQEVFDESANIFVPITTQEVFDEIDRSREETLSSLVAEGLVTEAETYTVTLMTRILTAMGFSTITVRF